jgi:hypothetical protein
MRNYSLRQFSLLIILLSFNTILKAEEFEIARRAKKVSIICSRSALKLDSLTAHLLAEDIQRVSGYLPPVLTDNKLAKGNVIIIGSIGSAWINLLKSKLPPSEIEGKWECYNLSQQGENRA